MLELNPRQTLIVAILVLFLGRFLTRKIGFLREFNIPEPVSGGLIASLLFSLLYLVMDIEVNFALHTRDVLLVVFFTTIGLSSRFSVLVQGGKPLAIMLVLAAVYLFIQNATGLGVASLTGQPPEVGIIGGSVSLTGGHGTAIAWSGIFQSQFGIDSALETGIACATFGLICGGLIGGPVARFLIERHRLEPSGDPNLVVGTMHDEDAGSIDYEHMLTAILLIAVSMGIGSVLHAIVSESGLKLPEFVTSLFAGILVINLGPKVLPRLAWPKRSKSLSLLSDLSLGLFLSMSLMSLQLWTLSGMGWAILLMMLAQVAAVVLYVVLVMFRLMGRDYDAAVMCAGYAGMAMGATPTAIANMTAVTERFGASAKAFIVIPLVGAFFIDLVNALVIQFFLKVIQ